MVRLGTYDIPTSWFDITVRQYEQLKDVEDENKILSILTGMDEYTINHLSKKNLYQLSVLLSFMGTPIDFDKLEADNPKDIAEKTYGQKILLQQHLVDNPEDVATIVAIYSFDEFDLKELDSKIDDIKELPITYVYPLAKNYVNQLTEIVKKENETLVVAPTSEQVRAGLNMFDEFGVMNTIRALADGDILKYENILKLDYNSVYLHLRMSKCETIFQRNYQKIMSKKK